MKIPKKILNKYILYKKTGIAGRSSSKKAIYKKGIDGELIFAKLDSKNNIDIELMNQQLFYKKYKQIRNGVIVPKIIERDDYAEKSILLIEYIPGSHVLSASPKTYYNAYFKVLEFINQINLGKKNYKSKLRKKSTKWQAFTISYFLLRNLYHYPTSFLLFIKSTKYLISMLPQWRKVPTNWLNHGDINVKNILVADNKIVLLDFADSFISHKYYDASRTLNSFWKANFHDKLWDDVVKMYNFNSKEEEILKSFVIFNLMQRLGMRYSSKENEYFYLNRLEDLLDIKGSNDKRKILQILNKKGYFQKSNIKIDESLRFNGIFTNKNDKKVFVKATVGKDSYRFQSLLNEAQVTKYLSNLTRKLNLTNKEYRLYTPKLIEIIDEGEYFCLITEYVKGKNLLKFPSATQAEVLLLTSNLISNLNNKIYYKSLRRHLKRYSKRYLVFTLPIRFARAIALSPSATFKFSKVFFKSLTIIFSKKSKEGLVHPDINSSNIIVSGRKIFLTDWEEAGWGISDYNKITPLCVQWKDKILREKLLNKLVVKGDNVALPLISYRTLMLFNQKIKRGNLKRKRDYMILNYLVNN